MNCRDFERLASHLARKQLIDEETSRKALAHAESCPGCERKLAEERILSARLHLLGVSMERESPPVKLKTTLLSAYRRRRTPATRSLSTVPTTSFRLDPWNGRRVAVAAASVFLSFLSLQLFLTLFSSLPTKTEKQTVQTLEPVAIDDTPSVELATEFIPLVLLTVLMAGSSCGSGCHVTH